MTVEELIEYLQKLPQDFEIYSATYQNFGKPNQSKEIKDVVVEMGTDSVTLIS